MSESLLSSLDSLSKTIFGSAHDTVMHSDAIVFLSNDTIADWPNFCKRQTHWVGAKSTRDPFC